MTPPSPLPRRELDRMLALYRTVCTIRAFETRVSELYRDGEIPGFVHVSLGQEAVATGACAALRPEDKIVSNHRGHGHCIAKGMDPLPMFAELFGKAEGVVGGRGGSMHIADPGLGILGANGIVGAGLPIAVGAALAGRVLGAADVVVAFYGDGAVAQGAFHEAVNLAALWKLPVVFLCENNGYAEFTPAADGHPATLAQRARGYGVPYAELDGSDVWAVYTGMTELVARARDGGGPVIVEAMTARWHGHYEGDQQRYRDAEHLRAGRAQDPVRVARGRLRDAGVAETRLDAVVATVHGEIEAAIARARAMADPRPETFAEHVTAPRPEVVEPEVAADAAPVKYMQAIRDAISDALDDDERLVFSGIDVAAGGGVFAVSRGLHERHPDRVLDTPISETAILGVGVGGAMAGLRTLTEIMYIDFIGVAFDQVLNQAAKLPYMTAGKTTMPFTLRTQFGAGRSAGAQHSQSLEALFAHIPGLSVVMPATSADAYGLMRTALEDPNPVVFIENRTLYGRRSPGVDRSHRVPIGKARIARPGSDITVVSYSRLALECESVAEELAGEGIDVEVVDLRSISPLDRETVLASVAKTNRLVVVHEAVADFGVGAEVVTTVVEHGFWTLDAPIERVAAAFSPAPYAPALEAAWLPQRDDIAAAIRRVARF
ncbi:pyruvate dehydrogenase complex E1 component subunit beta [Leucobacter allii]|uniref:alpha-ketoacid dehydrogenase subunit alpha/beta n=1 Tax=Leucobacter allii TaxID=2932247 RepID=UPI001FD2F6B4|nr:alpha-ketoacid dehydrogenase subunit alpha/beta [Leucobacter allii]UOR01315.1 pyruvate dehydrogenase complex E1 component subunit beta [Leucobacter allii]